MENNKYKNGKIYEIVSKEGNCKYIGSTTESLKERLRVHRNNYKSYENGNYHYVTSFELIKHDDAQIQLLEAFPCENRKQLHEREGYYIRNINCVNKVIPCRSDKEYREDNKDKIQQKKKEYYENNKEYYKQYHEDNSERIKKYKQSQMKVCECNGTYRNDMRERHFNTKKHKTYILNNCTVTINN